MVPPLLPFSYVIEHGKLCFVNLGPPFIGGTLHFPLCTTLPPTLLLLTLPHFFSKTILLLNNATVHPTKASQHEFLAMHWRWFGVKGEACTVTQYTRKVGEAQQW